MQQKQFTSLFLFGNYNSNYQFKLKENIKADALNKYGNSINWYVQIKNF